MFKLRILRSILICLAAAFSIIVGKLSHAHIFDESPEPGTVEIHLSDAGVVTDFKFKVKKNFPHWFSIKFWISENDQAERARVRKLLGGHAVDKTGKPVEPYIATPINLKIFAECA